MGTQNFKVHLQLKSNDWIQTSGLNLIYFHCSLKWIHKNYDFFNHTQNNGYPFLGTHYLHNPQESQVEIKISYNYGPNKEFFLYWPSATFCHKCLKTGVKVLGFWTWSPIYSRIWIIKVNLLCMKCSLFWLFFETLSFPEQYVQKYQKWNLHVTISRIFFKNWGGSTNTHKNTLDINFT